MKKFFFTFLLLVVSSTIPILLAAAETTPPPEVDAPLTPVDANKAIITGTADPFAQITVIGGLYQVPSVDADEHGKFSITVALGQESENIFWLTATNTGAEPSEPVEVVIEEGEQITADYEAQTGEDHTAPDAPDIEETTVETANSTYTIEGSGEEGTTININNEDSNEKVGNDGNFSVEVALSGGDEKDTFTVSLKDHAGNLSSGVKVYVTGTGAEGTVTEDNNEEKPELTDIGGHWAETYILQLYNDDVISGYGDGRFGPDDSITRAQIVKIALLAFDLPVNSGTNNFSDVNEEEWYVDYVTSAAVELGIVSGYEDNTFRPDNNVTRGEALKIILEAGGISDFDAVTPNFSDVDTVADWFSKYTAYAKTTGLIGGYEDGTFRGNQSITRAEVSKIVVELITALQ